MLAANAVHEDATNYAAREVKAVYCGTKANVLSKSVVRVELTDDGRRKETEGIRYAWK